MNWATWTLGPRYGRFSGGKSELKPHSNGLIVLGTMLLWSDWFTFNMGASKGTNTVQMELAVRSGMNTMLGGISSTITGYVIFLYHSNLQNVPLIANCLLGGLVSVTGCGAYVDPWAALLLGALAGALTYSSSLFILSKGIDDPVDSASVHFFNGILGVLGIGFFHRSKRLYATSGDGTLLGTQNAGSSSDDCLVHRACYPLFCCCQESVEFARHRRRRDHRSRRI